MKKIAFIALTAIFAMTMNSCKDNIQKKDYPKATVYGHRDFANKY